MTTNSKSETVGVSDDEEEGDEDVSTNLGERAKLSISGVSYEIQWRTLRKFPRTRLGRLALIIKDDEKSDLFMKNYCDGYDKTTGLIYFERNPTAFPSILNYYISKKLHIPRNNCAQAFEEEMKYWGIPFALDECCESYFCDEWECTEAIRRADHLKSTLKKNRSKQEMEITKFARIQWKVWNLFENPETSTAAKIVSVVSNLIVVLSTLILCVNTHPDLVTKKKDGTKVDNPILAAIELVCIIWFTIEYLTRLASCPNKKKFLMGALNTIDLLAVVPYYIGKIIDVTSNGISLDFINARRFIQILRIIRIVRVFKLARHSTGLQVLGYTLKESSEELGLLGLLLMMGVTLFASLVYYAEEGVQGTKFKSIIEAFWWAIASITTVGYGDMNPVTTIGKMIGSVCCVSGILFIALPIPTIVGNFSKYFTEHRNKQKIDRHKHERLSNYLIENFELGVNGGRSKSSYRKSTIVHPISTIQEDADET